MRPDLFGFLRRSEVVPGRTVEANTVLYVLDNAQTRATAAMAHAELDLINLQAECEFEEDRAASAATRHRADPVRQTLRQIQRNIDNLLVCALLAGEVVNCDAVSQIGRFVKEGERVATITSGDWIVRSLATSEDLVDTKPQVGQKVRVRLLGRVSEEFVGTVTDVAPTGSKKIPSASLTQVGGGRIAVATDTMMAGEPFFEIMIRLDGAGSDIVRHGMTALVSFQAQPQTIGVRLYRSALRFLNKLRT